ncbi:MAG: hypothetical protein GF334_11850 [Candidatus Altiarchaeales archaeon]|nr:hypothetical protein [Candidatus Altiarchaeales archaeon]
MGHQEFLRIERPGKLFLVRDDFMDALMTQPTEPETTGLHLLLGEALFKILVPVNCTADEVMEMCFYLTPTQLTGSGLIPHPHPNSRKEIVYPQHEAEEEAGVDTSPRSEAVPV